MIKAAVCVIRLNEDGSGSTLTWYVNDPENVEAEFGARLGEPDEENFFINHDAIRASAEPHLVTIERP